MSKKSFNLYTIIKKKSVLITLIMILAVVLRINVLLNVATDFDERVYIPVSIKYAEMMKMGDIRGIIDEDKNKEHPILIKLIYGTVLLAADKAGADISDFNTVKTITRSVSMTMGLINILLIALVMPLAGLFMAVSTWHMKYSSEAMFDPGGVMLATAAFILFIRYKEKGGWKFYISAVLIGAAFAAKYITATTAIAVFPFLVYMFRKKPYKILGYISICIVSFFLLNPYLWSSPVERFMDSVLFHKYYVQGSDVKNANFPWFFQVYWLVNSVPWQAHLFPIRIDFYIFLSGIFGFVYLKKYSRYWSTLFIVNGLFLLVYPTKWPQYTLIFIPVLSIAAALGTKELAVRIRAYLRRKAGPMFDVSKSGVWGYIGAAGAVTSFAGIYSFIRGIIFSKTNPGEINKYIPLSFILVFIGVAVVFTALAAIVGRMKKRRESEYTHSTLAYIYVYPAVIGFCSLVGFPLALGIILSLSNYNFESQIGKIDFPNLNNYINILCFWGEYFWNSVSVTFMWTFITVFGSLFIGGMCALILTREDMRLKGIYKGLLILPWAVPVYITAFIWSVMLLKDYGIINRIIAPLYDVFPIEKINWLKDTFIELDFLKSIPAIGEVLYTMIGVQGKLISFPFISTVMVNIWLSFPFMMLVILSALKTIPEEMYEAAEIDGAGSVTKFTQITWPLIKPVIFPAIVLNIVWTFNQINIVILMFTDVNILIGGSYWLFDRKAEYAAASAYSFIIFGILLLYILFAKKIFKIEKIID